MAEHSGQDDHKDDPGGWADRPAFRRFFLGALIVAGLSAALAGFIPAFRKEDPHFAVEAFGAFFAIYGFAAFALIVLVGQHLRRLVARKEDYYDERE